jgi:Skp family chaperone for outer membrane proteins
MTDFSSRLAAQKRGILLFLAIVAMCVVSASVKSYAATAGSGPTGSVFASVDMTKIIASYPKRAAADAQFKQLQDQYSDVFKTQTANSMLNAADQTKLGTLLLVGDQATQDQKQQIADLETRAGKASDDLAALQQKKDATDSERVQLTQLTQQQTVGQQALQAVADQYRQLLDQQNQSLSASIASDIKAAVADVAKKQGIAVVFDSSVAIYASVDLTPQVITKLGGTK